MPYPGLDNNYVGLVIPKNLKENWMLIQDADINALPEAFKIQKKMIYVIMIVINIMRVDPGIP